MAIQVDIEKNFKGFSLKSTFESNASTTGILGASGSGKSMTLRCIAGIEKPDKGKIVINGKTVFDSEKKINLKPQERRIGYLFQNYALFPTMTVKDNILCGYRGAKEQREEKVCDFIRRYQLDGLENRYPSQLSGGQQQRVALARMMIGEPEVILLDEPFSALDGYLKDVLQKDMKEFLKQYSGDMLMVTHSRDEAFRFCNELMLLKEGKTLIFGETRALFEQPQLLDASRLTGCKNNSRIERLGDHEVYAVDWGISLHTEQKVEPDITHIAIRGHWIVPTDQPGQNCLSFETSEYVETTFEHQYLVTNSNVKDGAALWWMRPKNSFRDDHDENLPAYLYLPPEHLMLLK
ncbi:sulfate/molybdate ABC transporter ATP-binding protein [Blautia sp. MSJ-19]|uniref:sulfate/molybdate ABC transporter ATP-binding protein n=1 Tax=Blautia sp. MSJ-19 TaxID=2841517 RepID=UPI001C0F2B69|nr:ATP-binding cassette domain-containing protein [Blautia sp. MSJ-19]MBU5481087.1 ATP-binding cassette domain-containing protein [Blautia sp. MSJ-19]